MTHPDAVFASPAAVAMAFGNEPEERVLSSTPVVSVADEVSALARSLGTPEPAPGAPYQPDAFVATIRRHHDVLMSIKAQLAETNDKQRHREIELQVREKAVERREQRMAAYEAIQPVRPLRKLLGLWRAV